MGAIFKTLGTAAFGASVTTLTPALPTTSALGGLLFVHLITKNNGTHTTATPGWTKVSQVNSGASFTSSLWVAFETAAAPVLAWTGAASAAARMTYLADADGPLTPAVSNFGTNTGSGATHSSSALTTGDYASLSLYFDGCTANTAFGTPSGWTSEYDVGDATTATRLSSGHKVMGDAATSTGAISVTGGAAAWVQWQIEVKRSSAAFKGPRYRAAGARAQSASAATLTPALPTVDNAEGLLVCVVQSKNNASHTTATTGWTKQFQTNSGASFTASIFTAREGAAAPVITWTGAAACAARVAYYTDPENAMSTTLGASSVSTGSASPHTSAGITTTDRSTVLIVDAVAANTSFNSPTSWPAANANGGSATDAGANTFISQPHARSGDYSGDVSAVGGAAAWVQWQIEILAVAAGPLEVSKFEVAPLLAPPRDQLSVSKFEIAPLLAPPRDQLSVSKFEIAPLLAPPRDQLSVSKFEIGVLLRVGQTYAPAADGIVLGGQTPIVSEIALLSPGGGAISFSGLTPAVGLTLGPSAGALNFAGQTPFVSYATGAVIDDGFISILW